MTRAGKARCGGMQRLGAVAIFRAYISTRLDEEARDLSTECSRGNMKSGVACNDVAREVRKKILLRNLTCCAFLKAGGRQSRGVANHARALLSFVSDDRVDEPAEIRIG